MPETTEAPPDDREGWEFYPLGTLMCLVSSLGWDADIASLSICFVEHGTWVRCMLVEPREPTPSARS